MKKLILALLSIMITNGIHATIIENTDKQLAFLVNWGKPTRQRVKFYFIKPGEKTSDISHMFNNTLYVSAIDPNAKYNEQEKQSIQQQTEIIIPVSTKEAKVSSFKTPTILQVSMDQEGKIRLETKGQKKGEMLYAIYTHDPVTGKGDWKTQTLQEFTEEYKKSAKAIAQETRRLSQETEKLMGQTEQITAKQKAASEQLKQREDMMLKTYQELKQRP